MTSKLNREDILDLLRQHKPIMKERFGVTGISLYGSFARDEATEDSDIGVVVYLLRSMAFQCDTVMRYGYRGQRRKDSGNT